MPYTSKFDCHVHSDCSPLGIDSVISLCEQALVRGLYGFAVTDCCDCDHLEKMQFTERVLESVYCVYKARGVFTNQLVISSGIEVSQPLDNIEKANRLINLEHFDVVLASMKKYPEGKRLRETDYTGLTENEIIGLNEGYYNEVLSMVKWNNFDVLSNLAFPLRYYDPEKMPFISLHPYDDIIEKILKTLAESGKALEINTSGIRSHINMVLPPIKYLRMFRELGGEFVTVGSGSHSVSTIGADISEGINLISEAGFGYYCYFDQRKPVMINI